MDAFTRVKVSLSVVIYCLAAAAVPIYNKEVFSGGVGGEHGLKKYPYPIATAFLQLGLVAVVLALVSVAGHIANTAIFHSARRKNGVETGGAMEGHGGCAKSWLFGPHFLYKLRHVAPVGILFGLKYGITNWGLQLMPTGTHLLLQSTDLIWTVLVARIWNSQRLGVMEHLAALLSTAGSLMIGVHAGQTLDAPLVPLMVNCLTPLVLALCIATLRSGAEELFREDNILRGSVTATEFTAIKLFLSAFVALLLSLLLENGRIRLSPKARDVAWWTALAEQDLQGLVFLFVGGIFVLIFQVNITWLTALTSTVTVGVVGGLKVVPQWGLNAAFNLKVDITPLNIAGAVLVLSASLLYAASISSSHELRVIANSKSSFELAWVPRNEIQDELKVPWLNADGATENDLPESESSLSRKGHQLFVQCNKQNSQARKIIVQNAPGRDRGVGCGSCPACGGGASCRGSGPVPVRSRSV